VFFINVINGPFPAEKSHLRCIPPPARGVSATMPFSMLLVYLLINHRFVNYDCHIEDPHIEVLKVIIGTSSIP